MGSSVPRKIFVSFRDIIAPYPERLFNPYEPREDYEGDPYAAESSGHRPGLAPPRAC